MATSEEVVLLMVNRRNFNANIGDAIVRKRAELVPFLASVSIFQELKDQ